MKKRVFSAILAVLIILTVLSACGKDTNKPTDVSGTNTEKKLYISEQ